MMKHIVILSAISLVCVIGTVLLLDYNHSLPVSNTAVAPFASGENEGGPEQTVHPLSIQALQEGEYPGSDLVIEQTLTPGSNYQRYIASYKSEGLKIYALLTIPNGVKPETGWPVVIFNHGYIPPAQYKTTERYIAYTDAFSRNGYIVLRSDYRGHGNSEGSGNSYGSNGYSIDVLNAVSSIKQYADADPNRIGMWGHSMGGHITLRNMVASKDIKAGVIWAGVVASYPDLLEKWRRGNTGPNVTPSPFPTTSSRGGWRRDFLAQYGTPEENPEFWNSISANSYVSDISGPLQLHHGTSDHSVPHEFSETLAEQLKQVGKEVELYIYPGDEHDIPNNFGVAMQRSVAFFDKYVKGEVN
jgi:dipeptidyl aminopeptidase/acylaminoacyl peptidase